MNEAVKEKTARADEATKRHGTIVSVYVQAT